MSNIISPNDLIEVKNAPHFVLIDARVGAEIREKYQQNHLKGALFVDLETELSDKKANPAEGGRHPLPTASRFASLVGKLGITPESHVVVYDDKNGSNAAARFWWMLRALGHPSVSVLDGGMQAAIAAGYPLSSGTENPKTAQEYPSKEWQLMLSDIHEVENVAHDDNHIVIDVRDNARYLGKTEPIDLIAGHIPGAVNMPFTENLDENGFFLTSEALHEKYKPLIGSYTPANVIVHCGSGVTACHTLLAISEAGFDIPKLYVGSWSEWSRTERPIATE